MMLSFKPISRIKDLDYHPPPLLFLFLSLSLSLDLWQAAHLRAPVLWWVQWTGMQQESLDQGDFTLLHVFPGLWPLSITSVQPGVCDSS